MKAMEWIEALWPEWTLEAQIGAGSYGSVYRIRRQDVGGTYYAALKVIPVPGDGTDLSELRESGMDQAQIAAYFRRLVDDLSREFSVMERLKGHTNIVSYEDHKIVPRRDGIGWDILIRMELLTPLAEHLSTHSCTEGDVRQLGLDICSALMVCQRENIIHRDIKPGNIFLSPFGDYKLGDFSLARTMGLETGNRSPRGTLFYMAPESYYGGCWDFSVDTYALGLILYRLLNHGRAPFLPPPPEPLTPPMVEAANWQRLRGEELPRPDQASPAMSSVILRACSYEPGRRYLSAREMRQALERCQPSQHPLPLSRQVIQYLRRMVAPPAWDGPTVPELSPESEQFFAGTDFTLRPRPQESSARARWEPVSEAPPREAETGAALPPGTEMDSFFTEAGNL